MRWLRCVGLALFVAAVGCGSDAAEAGLGVGSPAPTPNAPATSTETPNVPAAAGGGAPSPPSGLATGAGTPAALPPSAASVATPSPAPAPPVSTPTPSSDLDECGLASGWSGDEYCIAPPPVDQGFQMHVGPSNYANPAPRYVLAAGAEVTENFATVSGNTSDIYYYYRQYRMRPGTHHMIVSANGRRLGGSQNLAKDNPDRGVIAPESQGVGMKLAARSPLNVSLHYINLTDKPILKEVWVNFWYRDAKDVTESTNEIFSIAPINIPPGQHVLLEGTCPISQPGRILTLYGHRHANNQRFAAWRVRGSSQDLVLDDYNWEDPAVFEYSSIVSNPPPDPAQKTAGGWSGVLDLMPGDALRFQCEIINQTDKTFVGLNEAKDDEMCILVGDSVEASVPSACAYTTMKL
jgi:hypothetical protein